MTRRTRFAILLVALLLLSAFSIPGFAENGAALTAAAALESSGDASQFATSMNVSLNTSEANQPEQPATNWLLIILIAVACVLAAGIGVLLFFLLRIKRKTHAAPAETEPWPDTEPVAMDWQDDILEMEEPARPKQLWLFCRGGYQADRSYPVTDNMMIGRGADCNIRYPNAEPGISLHHATLRLKNGELTLTDTSKWGVFLRREGEKQSIKISERVPVKLKGGDRFYLATKDNEYIVVER